MQPRMSSLHHPATSPIAALIPFRVRFLSPLLDLWLVATPGRSSVPELLYNRRQHKDAVALGESGPVAPSPRRRVLRPATLRQACWPRSRRAIAGRHARRLINFAGVLFSPDPWGSLPRSASPRQSLPSRRTPLSPTAIVPERNPRGAIAENACGSRWHRQIPWAAPSTGIPSVARGRWRRTPFARRKSQAAR